MDSERQGDKPVRRMGRPRKNAAMSIPWPIPHWLMEVASGSFLNNRDMMSLFSIKSDAAVRRLAQEGALPRPSAICPRGCALRPKWLWQVKEVIYFIRRKRLDVPHA